MSNHERKKVKTTNFIVRIMLRGSNSFCKFLFSTPERAQGNTKGKYEFVLRKKKMNDTAFSTCNYFVLSSKKKFQSLTPDRCSLQK